MHFLARNPYFSNGILIFFYHHDRTPKRKGFPGEPVERWASGRPQRPIFGPKIFILFTLHPYNPYRTRDPLCCFGMTRNVKMGAESTIWMVDPSGRSTNGCRAICCFCPVRRHNLLIWACLQNQQMGAVPFFVSVHNLLIWACLQNQHSVQLTHFVHG